MPYPSQVQPDQIVQTARELIEREGVEAATLAKVATELGVRAPSLYRYFPNKAALLTAVNLKTLQAMFARCEEAMADATGDPAQRLLTFAQTVRRFAHEQPRLYVLAMSGEVEVTRPDEDLLVRMILPIQAIIAQISGEQDSLTALRGLVALGHGFILLEIFQQLQRGGDLEEVFCQSVRAYLAGWQRGPA